MVDEHNWRSTWAQPVRELRSAPLGGHCGETMELEGRELTINTPLLLLRNSQENQQTEQFWLKELRKRVRRYDTTWP